jgi:glutamate carboxypeptidase
MDTVHAIGSFGSPAVRIEGDRLIGPGVTDCKGGGIMAMLIMDALESIGWHERPIQLLLQSDEEVGSRYSNKATINAMCELAKDSLAFFNLEGYLKGRACIERKGIVRYTVNVYGKAAHSSLCAKIGSNAIVEAASKIVKIDRYKEAEGITCNVGTITGGTVSNTVPDKCSFEVDVRFANSEQRSAIDKILRDIVSECTVPGCEADITVLSTRAAMKREERNLALLDRLNSILSDAGMDTLAPGAGTGGSDAAEVTEYGIPCIDSLGVEGENIHQLNEFSYIPSLVSGAKRIGAFIYAIED